MAPKANDNHNSVGNLVPLHKTLLGHNSGKRLDALLQELQLKSPWESSSKGWQVLHAPLEEVDQEPLATPAFTCVVGLPNTVGVLKIASSKSGAANCTLFVRLKRNVLDAWCDANGQPKQARRAFRRALDAKQAANVLNGMQVYCLKEGQVHHPQALSVLCPMTLGGWLTLPSEEQRPPTERGSFTLVALPPVDSNLEQCLTMLGHKTTFKAPSAATVTDSDDEDTPLSNLVDKQLWGSTHGAILCSQWVPKFQEAARIFRDHADPKVLSHHVPALNQHASDCARVMEKTRTLFAVTDKEGGEKAPKSTVEPPSPPPPPPPPPPPKAVPNVADKAVSKVVPKAVLKAVPKAVPKAAPKAKGESSVGDGVVVLAPSDPSDNGSDSDDEAHAAPVAAALPGRRRERPKDKKVKAAAQDQGDNKKRKRACVDDSEDDDDDDAGGDSLSSAHSSSSEDDEEDDEGADNAVASERDTSDDEGSDSSHGKGHSSAAKAHHEEKKKQRVELSALVQVSDAERAAAASAELAAKEQSATMAMREVAMQSSGALLKWRNGGLGPGMTPERKETFDADLGEVRAAKSPMALVASMAQLLKTLVDAHHDHFKGETCEVPTAHEQRLRAACNQAVQFSDATMERLDTAIHDLTEARDMGREVLKQIASPGTANAPSSA